VLKTSDFPTKSQKIQAKSRDQSPGLRDLPKIKDKIQKTNLYKVKAPATN
jgi:hypothetical protein